MKYERQFAPVIIINHILIFSFLLLLLISIISIVFIHIINDIVAFLSLLELLVLLLLCKCLWTTIQVGKLLMKRRKNSAVAALLTLWITTKGRQGRAGQVVVLYLDILIKPGRKLFKAFSAG